MEMYSIYGLYSTNQPKKIRYVGQTKNPELRLKDHINAALKGKKSILYDWMGNEIKEGYHIRMTIFTQCESYEKNKMEKLYIEKHKGDLLNTSANEENSTYNLHTQLSILKEELEELKENRQEIIIEKIVEKKVYPEPTYAPTKMPGENRKSRKNNPVFKKSYQDAFRFLNGG